MAFGNCWIADENPCAKSGKDPTMTLDCPCTRAGDGAQGQGEMRGDSCHGGSVSYFLFLISFFSRFWIDKG